MKFACLLAIVLISMSLAECLPKKAVEKKKCDSVCTAIYDPVCAQDQSVKGGRPRSFASKCVMDAHNCEHGSKMEVIQKGECPNSGGIRLS